MARLVKFTSKQPLPIEAGDKKIWICTCGLSDKFPYCSGKHKYAADEEEDKTYIYDENFNKKEVKEVIFKE